MKINMTKSVTGQSRKARAAWIVLPAFLLFGGSAAYGAQHDHSVSYSLYLTTYAIDSVADVFGSLLALATGLIVLKSGVLPRWLGRISLAAGLMFFLQAFGLGGVIASFGLVLDIIGFVLFLIFVLASSVIFLRRQTAVSNTEATSTGWALTSTNVSNPCSVSAATASAKRTVPRRLANQ